MAHISSGPSEWSAPDWFVRGVIAVLLVYGVVSIGGIAAADHQQIWINTNSVQSNAKDIVALKERAKIWDQTPTDIAVIRQDLSNVKDQNKEILLLLRERRGGRNDR